MSRGSDNGDNPSQRRPCGGEATAGSSKDASSTATVKGKDVVWVHSPHPSGKGFNILRQRDQRLELGAIQPLEQGQAIHGEVVRLHPREDAQNLFDAETLFSPEPDSSPSNAPSRKGPAKVTSEAYRQQWDAIFGRRKTKNDAPN